jgi:hypothetical protein
MSQIHVKSGLSPRELIGASASLATTLFLAGTAILQPGSARAGALCGLGGMLVGLAFAVWGTRKSAADQEPAPSRARATAEVLGVTAGLQVSLFVFIASIFSFAWIAADHEDARRGSALAVVPVAAAIAMVLMIWVTVWGTNLRREGVERDVTYRSMAVGFMACMSLSVFYGMLEAYAGAPELSMWVPWTVGMMTWGVASIVLSRRHA